MSSPAQGPHQQPAERLVFHAEGLTKIYRMGEVDVRVLTGVDLELYRGEFVVLFHQEQSWAVFTVAGGRARMRPVEVAKRGGRFTRVVSGLEQGEAVIVHPPREVEAGTRVRTRQPLP